MDGFDYTRVEGSQHDENLLHIHVAKAPRRDKGAS